MDILEKCADAQFWGVKAKSMAVICRDGRNFNGRKCMSWVLLY